MSQVVDIITLYLFLGIILAILERMSYKNKYPHLNFSTYPDKEKITNANFVMTTLLWAWYTLKIFNDVLRKPV